MQEMKGKLAKKTLKKDGKAAYTGIKKNLKKSQNLCCMLSLYCEFSPIMNSPEPQV